MPTDAQETAKIPEPKQPIKKSGGHKHDHPFVADRILVHLAQYSIWETEIYNLPYGICQNGIEKEIKKQHGHASVVLKNLIEKGLVSKKLAHVRDRTRARICYFITPSGRLIADELKSKFPELEEAHSDMPDDSIDYRDTDLRRAADLVAIALTQLSDREPTVYTVSDAIDKLSKAIEFATKVL